MKLTNSVVESLPYHLKKCIYFDDQIKGFGVAVSSKSKTYIVQYSPARGKTLRVTIGRHGLWSADRARKEAMDLLVRMHKGENPNAEKQARKLKGVTLGEAAELFLGSTKERSDITIQNHRDHLDRYLKEWKDKQLVDITRKMAWDKHQRLGKERGPYAANNAMRTFRAIWNRAMKQNEELPICPTINVDWFKETRRQQPIPQETLAEWYQSILRCKNPVRRDYNLLMLFTGLRRRDAASIRWEELDLEKATLHRPKPKGGTKRAFTIPISSFLVEILLRRKEQNDIFFPGSPWVFPAVSAKGYIVEPLEDGLTWSAHRLRDTYTTAANAAGLSVYDIEVLTNHRPAQSSVTAGYINQGVEGLRVPQQKVTNYLLSLIFPENKPKVLDLDAARAQRTA